MALECPDRRLCSPKAVGSSYNISMLALMILDSGHTRQRY